MVPEDIGQTAAQLLLEEVARGGVVDSTHQGLLLLLCAVGPEEINQVGFVLRAGSQGCTDKDTHCMLCSSTCASAGMQWANEC